LSSLLNGVKVLAHLLDSASQFALFSVSWSERRKVYEKANLYTWKGNM